MRNINPSNSYEICPVCNKPIDPEYGVCDLKCPRIIHEEDQLQAEVDEAMKEPADPELVDRAMEVVRDVLAYARFKRDLKGQ